MVYTFPLVAIFMGKSRFTSIFEVPYSQMNPAYVIVVLAGVNPLVSFSNMVNCSVETNLCGFWGRVQSIRADVKIQTNRRWNGKHNHLGGSRGPNSLTYSDVSEI